MKAQSLTYHHVSTRRLKELPFRALAPGDHPVESCPHCFVTEFDNRTGRQLVKLVNPALTDCERFDIVGDVFPRIAKLRSMRKSGILP